MLVLVLVELEVVVVVAVMERSKRHLQPLPDPTVQVSMAQFGTNELEFGGVQTTGDKLEQKHGSDDGAAEHRPAADPQQAPLRSHP